MRELFRNLVTAQGTRATLDRDELLSVFAGEAAATQPGGGRAGARRAGRCAAPDLVRAASGRRATSAGHRRIEIVHESLLTAWPRLVRWQTQDQDGAQLRDQLRQAARLWEERGRPEDLLWTGTSFREYELWRERYAGTLSASRGHVRARDDRARGAPQRQRRAGRGRASSPRRSSSPSP